MAATFQTYFKVYGVQKVRLHRICVFRYAFERYRDCSEIETCLKGLSSQPFRSCKVNIWPGSDTRLACAACGSRRCTSPEESTYFPSRAARHVDFAYRHVTAGRRFCSTADSASAQLLCSISATTRALAASLACSGRALTATVIKRRAVIDTSAI